MPTQVERLHSAVKQWIQDAFDRSEEISADYFLEKLERRELVSCIPTQTVHHIVLSAIRDAA